MTKLSFSASKILKSTIICLSLLYFIIGCANSARLLDEVTSENPLPATPDASDPVEADVLDVPPTVAPAATFPGGDIPATPAASTVPPADAANTISTPVPSVEPPVSTFPGGDIPATPAASTVPPADAANTVSTPVPSVEPPVSTSVEQPAGKAAAAATGSVTHGNANGDHATLSFFMHDVLGGSHPSGRVVTGVIANSDANNLPFSKANSQVFPINGGVPLNTINGIINNNNFPVLAGLNGQPTNIQNNGNNNVLSGGGNQPFVSAGQLPSGLSLQELMFGSITVVDNEVTEGHELGTAVIGRAQGFYVASSQDGSSHTLALTTLFHGGEHQEHGVEDTISFFGVHRTAIPISHLAVIGGTGRYENAKGHATIETELQQENDHTTDGVETITHFTVYITP